MKRIFCFLLILMFLFSFMFNSYALNPIQLNNIVVKDTQCVDGIYNVNLLDNKIITYAFNGKIAISKVQKLFGYTLFSGDDKTDLKINTTNLTINGDIHSNSNVNIKLNSANINGTCESVGLIKTEGFQDRIKISNIKENVDKVEMPDFSDYILKNIQSKIDNVVSGDKYFYKQIIDKPTEYLGNVNFDSCVINAPIIIDGKATFSGGIVNIKDNVYCKSDVLISCGKFNGAKFIVADKDIVIQGNSYKNFNYSGNVPILTTPSYFYSKNGSIRFETAELNYYGLVYAPNGSIVVHGNNPVFYGNLIGKTLDIIPSNTTINKASTGIESVLNDVGIKIYSGDKIYGSGILTLNLSDNVISKSGSNKFNLDLVFNKSSDGNSYVLNNIKIDVGVLFKFNDKRQILFDKGLSYQDCNFDGKLDYNVDGVSYSLNVDDLKFRIWHGVDIN